MATKAKTTTTKKKTTVASARTTSKVTSSTVPATPKVVDYSSKSSLSSITPQVLLAEAVGTFGLAMAALTAPADQPLMVGIMLSVLLVGMMAVSGGHFNPAVTFGLWAARKFEGIKLPFYWIAQFIGALCALLVFGVYSGNGSGIDVSSVGNFDWKIFWVEFIGSAIFLFGILAVVKNVTSTALRAAGIGLSLVVGLVVAGGLLTANATHEQAKVQGGEAKKVSSTFAAQGAALNPAIALAQTERDVAAINKTIAGESGSSQGAQKKPTHFTLPVVIGSLLGAAFGAHLYMMLAGISWKSKEL